MRERLARGTDHRGKAKYLASAVAVIEARHMVDLARRCTAIDRNASPSNARREARYCGKRNDVDGPGRRCALRASSGFVSNARANRCAGVKLGHRALPIA